ncbi:MAG: diaminopimelate decarboxylase [Chloroflexota bacterium]
MSLNTSIEYRDEQLYVDDISADDIATHMGTPTYVYSLKRVLDNYRRIQDAFATVKPHVHYSAKANANIQILKTLLSVGAGIDCVSAGEIFKALKGGAKGEQIVFAGVGKTPDEIKFALENGVGWFNVENIAELDYINRIAKSLGRREVNIALRLNPEVTANTHPNIATGHGAAKFGLTEKAILHVLDNMSDWANLAFTGIHVHVGSQLHDTNATQKGVQTARDIADRYESITTLNIGGGMPTDYGTANVPSVDAFAETVMPLVEGYDIILEPGRSIIGDAGILITEVLYIKQQAGETFYIVDGSMTELIRPMLYDATHQIVPVKQGKTETHSAQVVGPVCETTDVLGRNVALPQLQIGDRLAILTVGAYGAVMASNYNARPLPPEIVIAPEGNSWHIARKRQSYENLLRDELE